MPTFRSSIYRIIVIIQCFLLMSLVLPGLTVPAIDSKLAIDARQTTTSVNSDQLSRIDNPASLIGHLRFLERESDTAYTVRDPSNRKVYSSPSLSRPPEARSWLDDATRLFGLGLTSPQHEVSRSINFRTGELSAWRVDIHDTSRAERPLLTIQITPQSLMLSTVVILLLGLVGSRWITRPVESIEKELLAIHNRQAHTLVPPKGNFSDFERLIQIITDYVKDQHESRSRAGYAASLLEQVISTIETAILVVDDNGTLRFSNRIGPSSIQSGNPPQRLDPPCFCSGPSDSICLIGKLTRASGRALK